MKEKENKLLKQAEEELAYLSGDPDFKRLVDARVGFLRDQNTFEAVGKEKGYKQGRAKGCAEGRANEKIAIAKKMLEKKMSIEDISELTGLTEEEIKKIEIDKN